MREDERLATRILPQLVRNDIMIRATLDLIRNGRPVEDALLIGIQHLALEGERLRVKLLKSLDHETRRRFIMDPGKPWKVPERTPEEEAEMATLRRILDHMAELLADPRFVRVSL